MAHSQYLEAIRCEAAISQRLWIKVLGMLEQNWCVTESKAAGRIDMVFFNDHGDVFDSLSAPDLAAAHAALAANGFRWMWTYSSFYSLAGKPSLPAPDARERSRQGHPIGSLETVHSRFERCLPRQAALPISASRDTLRRFIDAQDTIWYSVVEELASGHKHSHWMWYVFPQLRGLGSSRKADYFGLSSPSEAADYWDDIVLGSRLRTSIDLMLDRADDTSAQAMLGNIDAMKLRSCMTVFENVAYGDGRITEMFDRYFQGQRCPLTNEIIETSEPARRLRVSR